MQGCFDGWVGRLRVGWLAGRLCGWQVQSLMETLEVEEQRRQREYDPGKVPSMTRQLIFGRRCADVAVHRPQVGA